MWIVSTTAISQQASQFAVMALGNFATSEQMRGLIVQHGGVGAMITAILSSNVGRRIAGVAALANMALSKNYKFIALANNSRVVVRVIRMVMTNQVVANRETAALLHNLVCHEEFLPLLRKKNAEIALQVSRIERRRRLSMHSYAPALTTLLLVSRAYLYSQVIYR